MRWANLPIMALVFLAAACDSGATKAGGDAAPGNNGQAVAASGESPASSATSADAAAVANFRLTDAFIAKYEAYEEEAAKKPCELSPMLVMAGDENENRSLDQVAAAFAARPGVSAALQRHGLTAREMILGMTTLLGAAMQDAAQQHPEMVAKGEITMEAKIGPANMAVYNRHKDELHRHQMKLGQEQLKANGGKLPSCLTGE